MTEAEDRRARMGADALMRHAEIGRDHLGTYIELRDDARVLVPGSISTFKDEDGTTRAAINGAGFVTVKAGKYRLVEADDAFLVCTFKVDLAEIEAAASGGGEPVNIRLETVPVTIDCAAGRFPLSVGMLEAGYAMADAETDDERYDVMATFYRFEGDGRVLTPNEVVAMLKGGDEPTATSGAGKGKYRTHSPVLSSVDVNIDPVSNAVMGRHGANAIGPDAYWADEGVQIPTGHGGHAIVSLTPGEDVSVDAPYSAYQLNERDRYWYDHASTLFFAGQTEVTGAQILGLCGYSNPYSEDMESTMKESMESFLKGNRTMIAIDTTKEKRNTRRKNGKVISSITARQVVGAELSIETIEGDDGTVLKDFTLSLKGKTPEEAFPISAYARSRGMLTTIGKNEYTFKSVRPTIEVKQAWYYLIRCLHTEKRSNTILFETMWQDLELPEPKVSDEKKDGMARTPREIDLARKDAIRKQRERIRKQLEKMLDEAMENGVIESWMLSTDKKTGKPNGFKVTPVRRGLRGSGRTSGTHREIS